VTGFHSRFTVEVFRGISVSGRCCSENERVGKGYCISVEQYMEPCC